jgi:AraC-like DNA-binding protein
MSTSILSWTNAIAQALEIEGIESRELFEKAGIPYLSTTDPGMRIETRKISTLFRYAVEATQNPSFGLKLSTHVHPGTFHALGYSLFSSNTLDDLCKRLVRFFLLLSSNAQHHLQVNEDTYRLTLEVTNPDVCFETVDGWLGCIILFCRRIYRADFSPVRVELIRPRPASHVEDFNRFFKASVVFSAKENAIYFDKKDMLTPLPAGSTELARRNDEVVIEHLARLDRADIIRQVEAKIAELLPLGECNKEQVASLLNMSSRNLQNKLDNKSTSYQEILDNLRLGLARQYIEEKNMPISQITYLLGFSDTSNFSRAFRRWTGQSPRDFRKQQDANSD